MGLKKSFRPSAISVAFLDKPNEFEVLVGLERLLGLDGTTVLSVVNR
jgi:hypothetical protein